MRRLSCVRDRRMVHQHFTSPAARQNRAFTLIELLVVIAIIFIILALLEPAMIRDHPGRAPGVQCLSNTRQVVLAWAMYATDYQESLVGNESYNRSTDVPTNNWIAGVMDWSASPDNTNSALLSAGTLGAYIKYPGVYRCPADKSVSAVGPRTRSCSMNAFLGANSNSPVAGWKRCVKINQIRSTSTTFVLLDEHPNSIDDGYFLSDPGVTNAWKDLPASFHARNAGGFGFVDGHSEIHRWEDRSTVKSIVPGGAKPAVVIDRKKSATDLAWVLERATIRETNAINGQ